jgi:hypothetical protein
MHQMWNCLVTVSFGYLALLSILRIAQELNTLIPASRKPENSAL